MKIGVFVYDAHGQSCYTYTISTTECVGVLEAGSLEEAARTLGARLLSDKDVTGRLYVRLPGIKTQEWVAVYLEAVPSDPKEILRTCGRYRADRRTRREREPAW